MTLPYHNRLLLVHFLHIAGIAMLATIYPLFAIHVGANALQIGTSIALYNIVAGIMIVILGRYEDSHQQHSRMITFGYLLNIVGMFFYFFITNPAQLFGAQILNALALGLYMPGWKALYSRSMAKGREASGWGEFDGGNHLLFAVSATLAGYLAFRSQYQLTFLIITGLYLLATLLSIRLNRN